jgi:putative tryptophan/tyrosine transport system substrate-binding protein
MKYRSLVWLMLLILSVSGSLHAQDRVYNIGLVMWIGNEAFIAEMTELGYVQGENINYLIPTFENVAPEDFMANYTKQVEGIVASGVDIMVSNTDTDAINLQPLTGDIPVVFARSDDPVATGAVADLIKPGSHITGIVTNRPHERRLQILTEMDPTTKKIYYLYSPLTLEAETVLGQVQAVAAEVGVEVVVAPVTDGATGVTALKNAPEDIDWLFLTPYVPFDPVFFQTLNEVSMARHAGISWATDTPIPGYLMGYGPNLDDTARQAAQMVDRILRGANPGELPVETAENYLMVNLEAAAAINFEIPAGILRQADVIVRPGHDYGFMGAGS